MSYEEWEKGVPETITRDSVWKMKAYRLALFLADIGWHDVTKLMQDPRTVGVAGQLAEALGSIHANLAEGYSRGTGKDRARFYEYSLGSARESQSWYYQGRHVLGEAVIQHRLSVLSEIVRLTLTMVPDQRGRTLREAGPVYNVAIEDTKDVVEWDAHIQDLLHNVPLP